MKKNASRSKKLLSLYPKTYLKERGEEITATLQELDDASSRGLSFAHQCSVVCHGLQVRLGLTTESMFGKALDLAATPGLVMGAVFGLYLFIFGDVSIVNSSKFFVPHFGPFLTAGPLLYVAWILGVAAVFEWPQFRRRIAVLVMIITILGDIAARVAHRNPDTLDIALLISLGLPSVLAPTLVETRRRVWQSLAVGLVTAVALTFILHPSNPGFFTSIYWSASFQLSEHMPIVDVLLAVTVVTLWSIRKREIASAIVILSSPWIIVATFYPLARSFPLGFSYPYDNGFNVGFLILWAIGMVTIVTASRYRPGHRTSIEIF
ncbi:MAG TPA: hypothetical protein VIJ40_07860 [Acidimicrobiales bacterium]